MNYTKLDHCNTCFCNYTQIILVQTLLLPSSVPGNQNVNTFSKGCATILLTNKEKFHITIQVFDIKNITMAHIHFFLTKIILMKMDLFFYGLLIH
jgi:hypothetical protein